ncbi:MAG: hypothetical protein ABEI27_13940 [Halobellus sp.]|uniref:hypothetical protein n=1 Tax=Halobellus sp. TaxID=1979212 RepID=UPI0035D3E34A
MRTQSRDGALYVVIGVGYFGFLTGMWFASGLALRGGDGGFVGSVLAGGFVILLGGRIGLAYKIIADADRRVQ